MTILATGLGLVSPLGPGLAATCAAIRAGISSFTELESMVDRHGEPVIASVLKPTPLIEAPLGPALAACREAIVNSGMSLRSEHVTVSVLSRNESRDRLLKEADVERLARALDLDRWEAVFYPHGNAAGFRAMQDAMARIERNAKSVELILGADSLVGLPTLAYLEKGDRLKGSSFPRGLIPGEACACVVLQESATAQLPQGQPCLRLVSAHTTVETAVVGGDSPCVAEGLTAAIHGALDRAGWSGSDVGQVYCDLNGESYRAHEWMLTLCRCFEDPDVAHPADCVADVGSAFGPLLVCQAATAMRRGYARADRAVAFCSSDAGLRGCICVELGHA